MKLSSFSPNNNIQRAKTWESDLLLFLDHRKTFEPRVFATTVTFPCEAPPQYSIIETTLSTESFNKQYYFYTSSQPCTIENLKPETTYTMVVKAVQYFPSDASLRPLSTVMYEGIFTAREP